MRSSDRPARRCPAFSRGELSPCETLCGMRGGLAGQPALLERERELQLMQGVIAGAARGRGGNLDGSTVRRLRLRSDEHEAADPLAAARDRRGAAAWARTDKVVLIVDCLDGASRSYEQEIVEIIGVEDDDVVAEAAIVVRIPDLPPCLGRFWNVM